MAPHEDVIQTRSQSTDSTTTGVPKHPELLEHNVSEEDTPGGGFYSDDSTAASRIRIKLPEPVSACDTLTSLICSSEYVSRIGGSMPPRD